MLKSDYCQAMRAASGCSDIKLAVQEIYRLAGIKWVA